MATVSKSFSNEHELKAAVRKRIIQVVVMVLIYGASMFLAAGRWDWLDAWLFLGLYVIMILANALVMDREVIAERSRIGQGTKTWDLVVGSLALLLIAPGSLIVAGLDERFGWSPDVPLAAWLGGLAGLLAGWGLFIWAVASNRFFSTTVRIQADREHTVVTQGAYRLVRHPGYVGLILSAIGTALFLRSYWALIPVGLGIAGLIVRTALEDRTLIDELPGYREYTQQTRYRLLPGVW